MASCPECTAELELEYFIQGEIIPCPDCGIELEVISVDPMELDLASEVDEDWGE